MPIAYLKILAPTFIICSALTFLYLERKYPYNKGQKAFRPGFWVDLIGYGLFQSVILTEVIGGIIYFIDRHTGMSRLQLLTAWPIWLQVLFFIVTHDLVTYCIHRTQHNSKYLWRTHEAHHAGKYVDWLSGIRSHSLEILLYQTAEFLPFVLLGGAPEVLYYKAMLNSVYGMYIHANLDVKHGKWLWIFNSPELHRWHHAEEDPEAYDKNFATKFTFWDVMFGSLFLPKKHASEYGIGLTDYPDGYFAQHLHALRPFPKESEGSSETVTAV